MILRQALSLASRGRLSIMIFHRVLSAPDPLLPQEPAAADFEALVIHLKRRFSVLPLAEGVRRLYDGTLPAGALSLTFDDGYTDNLAVAAPILARHGVPATVFIATGYLDGASMFNDTIIEAVRRAPAPALDLAEQGLAVHPVASDAERRAAIDAIIGQVKYRPPGERLAQAAAILRAAGAAPPAGLMLDRAGVRKLAGFGVDVGAHTVTHPILAESTPADAWREISDSKRDLEATTGAPLSLFAYPNGKPDADYKAEHVRMVREAGFAAAVTTAWGVASRDSDRLQLPRFTPWTRAPLKFDLMMLRNMRHGAEQRAA